MKFLVISQEGDSLCLQEQLLHEGHDVRTFIKDPNSRGNGQGMVTLVDSWEAYISWANVVVCDETRVDGIADTCRQLGKLVVGGTKIAAQLEQDRVCGMQVAKEMGVQTPTWFGPFQTLDQIIAHVRRNPGRYVIKPSGQADRDLTYCSSDADDLIEEVQRWKKAGVKINKGCILQEFIKGYEIAIGCFVSKGSMIKPFFANWEHKKLLNGDHGPNTGEVGTLGYWCDKETKLGKELQKMEKWLYKEAPSYTTYFDMNFMISGGIPYLLEFTCRFGYPTTALLMSHIPNFGDFLKQLAEGMQHDFYVQDHWGAQAVLYVPGFPFLESFEKHGADKPFEYDANLMYPYEICYHDGSYHTVKGYGLGCPAIITATANGLDEAVYKLYRKIEDADLSSDVGYRTDIGQKAKDNMYEYFDFIDLDKDDLSWIGFDFHGTLADDKTLEPIPAMVDKLRSKLSEDKRVKILTGARKQDYKEIREFLEDNDLPDLEITDTKDPYMIEFFDDVATTVETNTGKIMSPKDSTTKATQKPDKKE